MPFHGKKTEIIKSRGHHLLTLVPKPGIDSDQENSEEEDYLQWDEDQLEAGVNELFHAIGFVDFELDDDPSRASNGPLPEVPNSSFEIEITPSRPDDLPAPSCTRITRARRQKAEDQKRVSVISSAPAESSDVLREEEAPLAFADQPEVISGSSQVDHSNKAQEKRKKSPPRIQKQVDKKASRLKKKVALKPLIVKWKKTKFSRCVSIPPCHFEADPNEGDIKRSAVSYFYDLFSEQCINHIVHHTNLYSLQQTGTSVNVDQHAIKAFLGIQLLMGIIDLPAITDYWSHHFRQEIIADVMSLKKFLKIRRYIHFANNEELNDDPFFKIRPIAELIRQNCVKIPPEKTYSVYEMMVPYKGSKAGARKQYMPKKPVKWGFKLFVRSGISGIVYDFLFYCGNSSFRGISFTPKEQEMQFSAQVVVAMCKSIQDPPLSTIFCDNFFTSISLMIYLRDELGILGLGTIRTNRIMKAPIQSEQEMKKKKRGWYEEFSDNTKKVALVHWMDSKSVLLTSTYVSVDPVEKIQRWSKTERAKVEIDCPQIVKEYNKHMGGVDLSDMLIELYRTPLRSHRWYLPVFAQLLDVCVDNAWLMYRRDVYAHLAPREGEADIGTSEGQGSDNRKSSQKEKKKKTTREAPKTLPLKEFRADIAESLIRSCRKKNGVARSLFIKPIQRRSNNSSPSGARSDAQESGTHHFPSFIKQKGKCRFCKKKQTTVYCSTCDMRLCFVPTRNCFLDYHKSLN